MLRLAVTEGEYIVGNINNLSPGLYAGLVAELAYTLRADLRPNGLKK